MDPFLGEIRMFAGNFAPKDWAFCNGQLLPIAQNTALFALLGVQYGGDGRTNFALPNLQGRVPIHQGQGPGLTLRQIGETGGEAAVTLNSAQLPSHMHALRAAEAATTGTASGAVALAPGGGGAAIYRSGGNRVAMDKATVGPAGSGGPHNNLQPYLAVNFIIALAGIFPSRP